MVNDYSSHGSILVAGSDPDDRELIRRSFESSGYEVVCCESVNEIDIADRGSFNVVLMELTDDIEDGLHAIGSIKQSGSTNTALLVFSSSQKCEVLVDALNAGADDYIIKPFSVRELSARVRAVLRSTRRG